MSFGRALIGMGLLLVLAGLVISYSGKLPFRLGRLPGDIAIEGKNGGGFYFPVVTCVLVSAVATALAWLFGKLR